VSDGSGDPVVDLSRFRDMQRARADVALIQMFSAVLGQPLLLRELTPEQRARREARLRQRKALRQA
jgi:hypothetical protein